jgi:hypothetical protein
MAGTSDKLDNLVLPTSDDVHRARASRVVTVDSFCHVGSNAGVRSHIAMLVEPMIIFKRRHFIRRSQAVTQQSIDVQRKAKL